MCATHMQVLSGQKFGTVRILQLLQQLCTGTSFTSRHVGTVLCACFKRTTAPSSAWQGVAPPHRHVLLHRYTYAQNSCSSQAKAAGNNFESAWVTIAHCCRLYEYARRPQETGFALVRTAPGTSLAGVAPNVARTEKKGAKQQKKNTHTQKKPARRPR